MIFYSDVHHFGHRYIWEKTLYQHICWIDQALPKHVMAKLVKGIPITHMLKRRESSDLGMYSPRFEKKKGCTLFKGFNSRGSK